MNRAPEIIANLEAMQFRIGLDGNDLTLSYPKSTSPDAVERARHDLRKHRQQVISFLKGLPLKYPGTETTGEEAGEIAERLERYGCILLRSVVLEDFIAFYRTEADRSKIPPGFVPYSEAELEKLFGDGSIGEQRLKLIHEAKKQGARIVGRGTQA